MVGDNIAVMKNPFLPTRGEPIGVGGTDTLEEERLAPTDAGDHERFSHYVRKEKITEAMVLESRSGVVWQKMGSEQRSREISNLPNVQRDI